MMSRMDAHRHPEISEVARPDARFTIPLLINDHRRLADYMIEGRQDMLKEVDEPMLKYGSQALQLR